MFNLGAIKKKNKFIHLYFKTPLKIDILYGLIKKNENNSN